MCHGGANAQRNTFIHDAREIHCNTLIIVAQINCVEELLLAHQYSNYEKSYADRYNHDPISRAPLSECGHYRTQVIFYHNTRFGALRDITCIIKAGTTVHSARKRRMHPA